MHYADILLPLNLDKELTYSLSNTNADSKNLFGYRAAVNVKGKIYCGIILKIHNNKPEGYDVKPVIEVLDESPIITKAQLKLWQWIASYYVCNVGEVLKAALPTAFNLDSLTKFSLNPNFSQDDDTLSEDELLIKQALQENDFLTSEKISEILGKKTIMSFIKTLIDKELIVTKQDFKSKYKPKLESFVVPEEAFKDNLLKAIEECQKSDKQKNLILAYISLSKKGTLSVTKKDLLEKSGVGASVLEALLKKGIFKVYKSEVSHFLSSEQTKDFPVLSSSQKQAFDNIEKSFDNQKVALLHGVTGSGKTEIYVHLIKKTIEEQKQVLYLVPEIALTTQLIERLRHYFGDKVAVYHSRFSDSQKAEVWKRAMGYDKKFSLLVGARSAVFLPFDNLGLVIVDEEHETSFKQIDPSPRYNGRDTAIVLAKQLGADVLLGSATPSLESYSNSRRGKYDLIELNERYNDVKLPVFHLVDLKNGYKEGKINGHFSFVLIDKIKEALDKKEQVIIFQNRRGYSPMIECRDCGYVPKCKCCDVSLTYHKNSDSLRCHYCGYVEPIVKQCPVCSSKRLDTKGLGTQQAELELKKLFPQTSIKRMDYDTTNTANSHFQIIKAFEDHQIDILVGTQMLSKGLDFDNVSLVGILNADNIMSVPDFRAKEKAFQLITQVSGRAGRKKNGQVVLQTYDVSKPIIDKIVASDYKKMFEQEMEDRKKYSYPPFVKLIKVTLKHKINKILDEASIKTADFLRDKLTDSEVLGPDYNYISKINNFYIKYIYVKVFEEKTLSYVKINLLQLKKAAQNIKEYRGLVVNIDVDCI